MSLNKNRLLDLNYSQEKRFQKYIGKQRDAMNEYKELMEKA